MGNFVWYFILAIIAISLVYTFVYVPAAWCVRAIKKLFRKQPTSPVVSVEEYPTSPVVSVEEQPTVASITNSTKPAPSPKKYQLRELIKWESDGDIWHCVFSPPQSSNIKYICGRGGCKIGELCKEYDSLLWGTSTDLYWFNNFQSEPIINKIRGVVVAHIKYEQSLRNDWRAYPNECLVSIDASERAISEYIAEQERKREENRLRILAEEKAEIAAKIKEKHRRRELEKLVRQELIDSGELYGEQTKRPPIPREVVDAVYKRDGGRCVYCGSVENLHLDHIIPFSRGGATNIENLQLLCQKCNLEKSNKIG